MHATCLITPAGPLLRVTLMSSQARQAALSAAGQHVAPPVSANLLIDTGASCTVIDDNLVAQLGLQATGSVQVHTPSTGTAPVTRQSYDIGLIIMGQAPAGGQGGHWVQNLPIMDADFSAQGIDGLLGRDVLSQCRMTYSGSDQLVFLSF